MFGQIARRNNHRDLIVTIEAHRGIAKFFGLENAVTHSNFSKRTRIGISPLVPIYIYEKRTTIT